MSCPFYWVTLLVRVSESVFNAWVVLFEAEYRVAVRWDWPKVDMISPFSKSRFAVGYFGEGKQSLLVKKSLFVLQLVTTIIVK